MRYHVAVTDRGESGLIKLVSRRQIHPTWFAPMVVALAIGIGALILSVGCTCRTPAVIRYALVGIVVAAWLVEFSGVSMPPLAFAIATVAPTSYLIFIGIVDLAPLFLCLTVAWIGYTAPREAATETLGLAIASLIPAVIVRGWNPVPWLPWVLGIGFSSIAAQALATQQRLLVELSIAQASLAGQAAAEERRRIARELHDVIAHSLAVTMLHLTGARHVLSRDPQRAADALVEAERLGRQSLADIRRTVGLLQSDRMNGTSAPLPTASDIPTLVSDYRSAGLDVQLALAGDPTRLSSAAGLGLYRIVQEALANVVKHAPGASAGVNLEIGEAAVTLCVTNTARREGLPTVTSAGGSGLGITGMRERASLLGGSLETGPEGAGWQVRCTIPL
jgi:signal transduction histidine kinase